MWWGGARREISITYNHGNENITNMFPAPSSPNLWVSLTWSIHEHMNFPLTIKNRCENFEGSCPNLRQEGYFGLKDYEEEDDWSEKTRA